jgi:NADH:ubiquinone oxidoreductase subunit F (NADH-binding)
MTEHFADVYPGLTPRLVIGESGARSLSLREEIAAGTYAPVVTGALIDQLEQAGLRGRGGSGFPAHRKWRAVRDGAAPRVVVANGEEGEPSSFKDRWLLTNRPHAVIDGLLLAAAAVGADRAVIYLSHPETVSSVRQALVELPSIPGRVEVELHVVQHRYVAGEESAVCRSINGGPALPLAKPPRPFECGVDGHPTLVSNVETLAQAAWIARNGADAYRALGTSASPGTMLVTLGGACRRPGVYEVPYGLTLGQLIEDCAGGLSNGIGGVLAGGWFMGVADASLLEATWCYDAMRAAGSGVGCGAVTVLGHDERIEEVVARLARWYVEESAQQCGVCVKGTVAIADTLELFSRGSAEPDALANLARWGTTLQGRGACAFLDGAANLAGTFSKIITSDRTMQPVAVE